jgi:hypothetical protein
MGKNKPWYEHGRGVVGSCQLRQSCSPGVCTIGGSIAHYEVCGLKALTYNVVKVPCTVFVFVVTAHFLVDVTRTVCDTVFVGAFDSCSSEVQNGSPTLDMP